MDREINYYKLSIALLVAFFLKTTFFGQLFGFFSPNLIMILLISSALVSRDSDLMIVAFFSGVVFDFFSTSGFGIFSACFLLLIVVVSFMRERFLKEYNFLKIILLAAFSAILYNLSYIFFFYFVFTAGMDPDYVFISQRITFDMVSSMILVHPFIRMISK